MNYTVFQMSAKQPDLAWTLDVAVRHHTAKHGAAPTAAMLNPTHEALGETVTINGHTLVIAYQPYIDPSLVYVGGREQRA